MKVYLDNSALNRPFDEQSNPKVHIESVAVLMLLAFIESGKIRLITSFVSHYENANNPFLDKKNWVNHFLLLATRRQKINSQTRQLAGKIRLMNIAPMDALHLACAEQNSVDYFITCDYDIIKRYNGPIKISDPVTFITFYNNENTH